MSLNVIKRAEVKVYDPTMVLCMRCHGRKKLFKIMGGYSHADTGGVLQDCPMCLGSGKIKRLEDALPEVAEAMKEEMSAEPIVKTRKKVIVAGL